MVQEEESAISTAKAEVAQGNYNAALSVTDWKGHNNYTCVLCGGREESLNHDRMIEHVRRRHGPPAAPQVRTVPQLVDRFGNPVQVEEQAKSNEAPTSGIGAQ